MIALSDSLRTQRVQLIATAIDASTDPGVLQVYSGPRPSTGADTTTQTLLVSIALPSPVGTVDIGVLTFANVAEAMAVNDGQAVWARALDSSGAFVMDMSVGSPESGADLELTVTQILAGSLIRVNAASIAEA